MKKKKNLLTNFFEDCALTKQKKTVVKKEKKVTMLKTISGILHTDTFPANFQEISANAGITCDEWADEGTSPSATAKLKR